MMENKANYPEMFFLFFAGSVLGFLLEGIWRVIRTGAWENHAATVWGDRNSSLVPSPGITVTGS